MLKNKNRLIQPSQLSKEQSTNKNDFFYRAYLNALQYYVDDPTCDYDNISFPAMYLYSLGDKYIIDSPDVKCDEFGDKKIDEPSSQVKKQVEFYSENLVSALQFRLQDRKYVLDINTYNYNDLEDFLKVEVKLDVDNEHPLFNLFMRNFSLKYFKVLDETDEKLETLFEKLNPSKIPESDKKTKFDGVFDEKDFQERYAKENNNRQILELDGYFKSELKEWKEKEDKKSLVDTNGIDLYPYVDGILYDNNKYFIAIALTERDENYIDDKTEEINKVFECSMFIYKNENETIKSEQLSDFNENLKNYLGRFVNKCSLYKLQEAMNGAIGEAADISRYWYSKGLDSIFNKETAKEFEDSEDSIEFYTKFVKELLCKIDGVKNTEIYPFDRVYLFPETGLKKDFKGIKKMRVLEAKIKSREPYDKGSYLMGWEQDVSSIEDNDKKSEDQKNKIKLIDEANDLIFSDKKINYMDWNFRNSSGVFGKSITNVNKKHTRGNLLLSNLLLGQEFLDGMDKSGADYKKLENMKRKIRDEFNEYGLYYEYDFGLNLKEQFEVLFDLQEKYFDEMAKGKKSDGVEYNEKVYDFNLKDKGHLYRGVSKKDMIENIKWNIKNEYKAKTITVCFDPERITKPELAQAANHLTRKDAITMVFVADKDFVKTTSELEAEIKDFEVLIQMIIRQVIYNTENAAKEIEIKKEVSSATEAAVHNLKAIAKDHSEIQAAIDNILIDVQEKLNTSRETIEFESSNVYNEILNEFFEGETAISNSSDLASQISKWLPKNYNLSNISITLHESFLPKMKMLWNDLSITTSFKVLLKNAAEYCVKYSQDKKDARLTLSMSIETFENMDFLVVNIINTTPPLTKSRFDKLNNEEIDKMEKDSTKEGSTGVGVVSARRQIKSISSFNNITFTMLSSNVISAKMYLKVELLNENNLFLDEAKELDKVESTSEQEDMNSCDVVYFEDSREYYAENIPLLKKYNVSVAHSVRKDERYMSDAKLLLTDMSILNSNDEAVEEEGLEGIYLFKKNNKNNAPICVLSNGEAGSIKKQIEDHLDEMISPDDVLIVKDFSSTLEDGKIFILNNVKTLDDTHGIVFAYLNSISSDKIKDDEVKEQENYELVPFTNNGNYTPEFDKLFSNLEHDISQKYFYIAQSSHTEVELTDILNKWLAFKTVRANKGDRKFAISNVTYHKNTLLIIDDIVLEDQREKWWLFYLGVKHNIIFNFLEKEHSDIVAQWSEVAVKRESSGYLGKLRHDVKNYQKIYEKNLKNTKLDTEFENIINATLELQKLLQLKKYESLQNFTQDSDQDSDIETRIDKLKILKYADEVEKRTNELRSSLKSAIEIMGNHTKDKTNVSNLISFKELIDFNIEFCTKNQKVSA